MGCSAQKGVRFCAGATALISMVLSGGSAACAQEARDGASFPAGAPASAPKPAGLVLWNRLGSEAEVLSSEVGAGGTASGASYVPGVFGQALEQGSQDGFGVTFPASAVPGAAGCVEFWARVCGAPEEVPWGPQVTLFGPQDAQGGCWSSLGFNGNDGSANGGLCARLGSIGSAGTGLFGWWTYATALKGASVGEWHHYALVWGVDGVPRLTDPVRRMAVYVDGSLNTGSWIGEVLPPGPVVFPEGGRFGLALMQGLPGCRVAVDNVKVWDYAKSDFEDRFSEEPDPSLCLLTVSGARDGASPANGVYAYAQGAAVAASVASPVGDGATRHVCAGATVEGNAFAWDGAAGVTLTLTNSAVLAWQWQTQYRLTTGVEGGGSVTSAGGWHDEGAEVVLEARADAGWGFAGWAGDTDGCVAAGGSIAVPMTRARAVVAVFTAPAFMFFDAFARDPANKDLKYKRLSGTWGYSRVAGGLFCESPAKSGSAGVQVTVKGPGILSFEWELSGADGQSVMSCAAGPSVRCTKKTWRAEAVSVAVPAGAQNIAWTVRRAAKAPEVSGILRNVVWTPLAQASGPAPADGQVLAERRLGGLSWHGAADFYRVYAGRGAYSMKLVGAYGTAAVPAAEVRDLLSGLARKRLCWRVDAVRTDSMGAEAVSEGAVWTFEVAPQGSPEFASEQPVAADLMVGVKGELGPFEVGCGLAGTVACDVKSGKLPPGMRAEMRNGAVVLAGVPSRAGSYRSVLQLSVKGASTVRAAGTTMSLDVTVAPLGSAAGDFSGWVDNSLYGEGKAMMSVTALGKITGKLSLRGTNYTFRADQYSGMTNGCCYVKADASAGAKAGFPLEVRVDADGRVTAALDGEPEAVFALFRDIWKEPEMKALLPLYAGSYTVTWAGQEAGPDVAEGGLAALTVQPDGRVRVAGQIGGKAFVSSGALLYAPASEQSAARVLFLLHSTPSVSLKRAGVFGVVEIGAEPGGAEPNALTELVPLRNL